MHTHALKILNKIAFIIILAGLTGLSTLARAHEDGNQRQHTVKVMTQNMDAGTDFIYLFSQLDVLNAATLTYDGLLQSNLPRRAALLAKQIAHQQPDLISLQEVTLWQTISDRNKKTVLYDQLQLLLKSLSALDQHYKVVAINNLTQNQLPIDPSLIGRNHDSAKVLNFTDRDVILTRSDQKKSDLSLSNVQIHHYQAILPLGDLGNILRGWISVDAKMGDKSFRFVDTHLETVIPSIPDTVSIQQFQADELINAMDTTNLPVILAGDFNADAEHAGIGPDQTATPDAILAAGYTDAWHEIYPKYHGFTWPLFFEDPRSENKEGPFERIDLIYGRDMNIINVQRIGIFNHEFASDHAGVVSTMQFNQVPGMRAKSTE